MRADRLERLSDAALVHELRVLVAQERTSTAALVVRIAEFDTRRLYLPAGFASTFDYCVHELGLSEDAAYKRIRAARAGRACPGIYEALASGRVHLSAVVRLAPHLTPENAGELLEGATGRSMAEIEEWLAGRFPRTELLPLVEALPARPEFRQLASGPVEDRPRNAGGSVELASRPVHATPTASVNPQADKRFALHVTIDQATRERLQRAQELLSHRIPSGDVAQVLGLALKALVERLEKRKFAATSKPRPRAVRSTANPRHIPAPVKRAVRERDRGQCTFVGETGHRCGARKFLEYDHIEPVARGGQSTVGNLRLRCRQHNDFEARRVFGDGFMDEKRSAARESRQAPRVRATADAPAAMFSAAEARAAEVRSAEVRAAAEEEARDVMAGLRELGVRGDEARRAVAFSQSLHDVTLEERMRAALRFLCPKSARTSAAVRAFDLSGLHP
jgi:hypothetical protein